MKNYEEVTKNVFRKSEELIARNRRRRNTMIKIGASACCLAVIGGVGATAWSRGRNPAPEEQTAVSDNNTIAFGGDTDVVGNPIITDSIGTWSGQTVSNGNSDSTTSYAAGTWCSPIMTTDNSGSASIITHISGFEVEDTDTVKIAPDNGQIHISKALSAAMEQYGDVDENGNEIVYHVVISYLQDRQTIPATYELWEQEHMRIKEQLELGLGFETYSSDWGAHSEHWIHADFTKSEIESFTADPNYGYVIDLYDNYHGYPITANGEQVFY